MLTRRSALFLYDRLLRVFPHRFRAEFAGEMREDFAQLLEDAVGHGLTSLLVLILRELLQAPTAIVRAYGADRGLEKARRIYPLPALTDPAGLTPSPLDTDGRDSWVQAALEALLFLLVGTGLLALAYLPLPWAGAGWQRAWPAGGALWCFVAVAGLALGLHYGLPRWAFPFGGLLFGCLLASVQHTGFLSVMVAFPPVALVLVLAADVARICGRPPSLLNWRFMAHRSGDPLRLAFGLYGALPLLIVLAYDDGMANNRTVCLAISVLAMAAGALAYARSRRPAVRALALLGAMSLAIWASVMDRFVFDDNLARGMGLGGLGWRLQLWAIASAFLFTATLPALIGRTPSKVRTE